MELPLALKIAYTVFVAVLVPVYWKAYGPGNFLWLCDVALFGAGAALWLESRLLASMMLLAMVPELVWNADFFGRLATGRHLVGMTAYMFDRALPLHTRALSGFHVFLPVLLVWVTARSGYDPRALPAQTALTWALVLASYGLTRPADNVNYVFGAFGPGTRPQRRLPPRLYLLVVLAVVPLLYWPAHAVLARLFPAP
ncbi:MAG: membrane-associated protein [Candidatus Rokuibacteriota bacterium]